MCLNPASTFPALSLSPLFGRLWHGALTAIGIWPHGSRVMTITELGTGKLPVYERVCMQAPAREVILMGTQ